MSAYENEWVCPKCRHYSTNADSCDNCGALISRILERENQREFGGSDNTGENSASLLAHEAPQPPVSLTAIALVLVLLILAGIIYFYQIGGFDPEPEASALFQSASLLKVPV